MKEITNETALINARLNELQVQLGVVETAKAVNAIRASTERLDALATIPEPVAEPAAPVEPIAPEPVAVVEAPKAEPVVAKAKPVKKPATKKAAVKAEPVKKTARKTAKK